MFKPPKMTTNKPIDLDSMMAPPTAPMPSFAAAPAPQPAPLPSREEEPRVWSPTTEPPVETAPQPIEEVVASAPTPQPIEEVVATTQTSQPIEEVAYTAPETQPPEEVIVDEPTQQPIEEVVTSTPTPLPVEEFVAPAPEEAVEPIAPQAPIPQPQPVVYDESRYARPKANPVPTDTISTPIDEVESQSLDEVSAPMPAYENTQEDADYPMEDAPIETPSETIERVLGANQKVVRVASLNSIPFSDIWYTAEKIAYIRDKSTRFALVPFEADDLEDFYKALEQGYTGQSSFAIRFAGEQYRVERIITLSGPQYNCRKMPGEVPDIYSLGLPKHIVDYLLTLPRESGLLLFGGPTGMGKTTSASALMKKYLEMEGGFMYTIEDPPEMPLDGIYHAANGGLGLCKQCPVDNERWGDGIKSALRSRPRYILVGEIRTPETASQVLRAATSGHLVLSTIHASTVEDALESIIKYASGAGLTESLAADLLARGILGVIHQKLEGSEVLRPVLTAAFANPHLTGGDQMRSLIRSQTINLQTLIEAQSSRLFQGRSLFGNDKID